MKVGQALSFAHKVGIRYDEHVWLSYISMYILVGNASDIFGRKVGRSVKSKQRSQLIGLECKTVLPVDVITFLQFYILVITDIPYLNRCGGFDSKGAHLPGPEGFEVEKEIL